MNRELDRQIAINFHPKYKLGKTMMEDVKQRERGFLDNMLAWDEIPGYYNAAGELVTKSFLAKEETRGFNWEHCKDDIWATENLPHYSEDLNLAIGLAENRGFELNVMCDGKWGAVFTETVENKIIIADAYSINPAEAICLARLQLRRLYGV